ncbi:transcription initiation factor TFIID subunit 4-like [Trichosurus vulpecula]|uniref:transcription initiation factor TFIID subunit 4-like n=1 Tax=Trichosurus vulpecula TaxID=9337 RepID=UPI00186B2A75|nr:transcription initiation factor TFIID subunit 4-like [Trichosurus vulpecula]
MIPSQMERMKPGAATIGQGRSAVISKSMTTSRNSQSRTTTTVETLNGSNVRNSPHSGSAVAFAGTPVAPAADGAAAAAAPSASSNTASQTSLLSTAASSSSAPVFSSIIASAGPPVALVRPASAAPAAASVAAATQKGNALGIDSTLSVRSLSLPVAAPGTAVGAGVSLQPSLGNSQLDCCMPATATTQVLNSEAPKTVMMAVPQQQTLTSGGQSSTGRNAIIGQTRQGGSPNGGGTANRVAQSLPGIPTAATGGIGATSAPTLLARRLPPPAQNPTTIPVFQLSPGMVLIPSEHGQLLLLPLHRLARMRAQAHAQFQPRNTRVPCPDTPTRGPPHQLSTLQPPATPLLARHETPTATVQPVSQAQAMLQPTSTLPTSLVLQPQVVVGAAAQTAALATASSLQPGTPQRAGQLSAASTATMEDVQKCQHYLSTLIRLASSGKRSAETAAKVKELVQNLLDGKMEAEEFSSSLYRELNASPRPYLVPFLKSTLPALRQLTAALIQQSQQRQPSAPATTALRAVVPSSSVQGTAGKPAASGTSALQPPGIGLTQPAPVSLSTRGQATPLAIQPPQKPGPSRRAARVTGTATPTLALPQPHNRNLPTAPRPIRRRQLQCVPVVEPAVSPATPGTTVSAPAAAAPQSQPPEPAAGSFGDDEDFTDLTSLARVNLSEERARILATNSRFVGTPTRSCGDETFLLSAPLQRRILEMGEKYGITELHPDVVRYVSHATEQRLRNLVDKVSESAQRNHLSYEDDERYRQVSDVRAQLELCEALHATGQPSKDEEERETFMRWAKSGSRREGPEELSWKEEAEESQQQEPAPKRQREAHFTALEGVGPRKKRKVDCPELGWETEASRTRTAIPGSSGDGAARQSRAQRITRVTLRNLIFCLENERESRHSTLLYKALLM